VTSSTTIDATSSGTPNRAMGILLCCKSPYVCEGGQWLTGYGLWDTFSSSVGLENILVSF
jgi:hypothetical protein